MNLRELVTRRGTDRVDGGLKMSMKLQSLRRRARRVVRTWAAAWEKRLASDAPGEVAGFVPRRAERGMSLVEIMVVVVIMGLVASVVGVAVFNALGKAQVDAAKVQISGFGDALDMYKLQYRKYPSTAEGLQALTQSRDGSPPVMEALPKDPWGNEYVYVYPGSRNTGGFDIISYGADGAQGGGDDVGNWEEAAAPQ
jgi:general secretion pathway protein G